MQREGNDAYQDRARWDGRSLANIAGAGVFSADRTIEEYAQEIWGLTRTPVTMPDEGGTAAVAPKGVTRVIDKASAVRAYVPSAASDRIPPAPSPGEHSSDANPTVDPKQV